MRREITPTLEWTGKEKVVNHRLDVPYRVLERKYSFDENGQLSLPPVIGLLADIIFLTPVSCA